ncbi:MAG: hypothetical protein KDI79_12995, partial [Anaerolineae bacterium]|nr:hypothetical protein [Anaerolineae bacterium]
LKFVLRNFHCRCCIEVLSNTLSITCLTVQRLSHQHVAAGFQPVHKNIVISLGSRNCSGPSFRATKEREISKSLLAA